MFQNQSDGKRSVAGARSLAALSSRNRPVLSSWLPRLTPHAQHPFYGIFEMTEEKVTN